MATMWPYSMPIFNSSGPKRGAWMTSFKPQQIKNGVNDPRIVCNFSKPTPDSLPFNFQWSYNPETYEFGHAFAWNVTTPPILFLGTQRFWGLCWTSQSGNGKIGVTKRRAWVILPNITKPSYHIPMEYIQKIKESATFHEGMQTSGN